MSDPNERIVAGTEEAATEEAEVEGHRFYGTEQPASTEQSEVEGHRYFGTEQDERMVVGTEGEPATGDEDGEPDVEGHRYH